MGDVRYLGPIDCRTAFVANVQVDVTNSRAALPARASDATMGAAALVRYANMWSNRYSN